MVTLNPARRVGFSKRFAREPKSDVVVRVISYIVVTLVAVVCLYPYLNVIAKSFSGNEAVSKGWVRWVWPVQFSTDAYQLILHSSRFVGSFGRTVFITVVGTALNLLFTIFVAYAVSRERVPGMRLVMSLYIFTMIFGGGLIPTYLVVIGVGLRNSLWALIIPGLVGPFNVVLMRNYMQGIPYEIEESARIDGASHYQLLFRVYFPLCLPSIATIALFCAVGYWNSYFDAMIYIDDRNRTTLQLYLRELMMSIQDAERNGIIDEYANTLANESMRGAAVFTSTLPIILVYPFLQKYYVKGITLGAVKG